jgi:hypothetical protein
MLRSVPEYCPTKARGPAAGLLVTVLSSRIETGHNSPPEPSARRYASRQAGRSSNSASGLLGFEPQLLSHRLPVKVDVLRANLIALNLNEGSPWIGDGATGSRGAVHKRAGVGAVQHPLNGDQAPPQCHRY